MPFSTSYAQFAIIGRKVVNPYGTTIYEKNPLFSRKMVKRTPAGVNLWYNIRMTTTTHEMTDNLLASKSILARLLASEDIDVQHQPVETASFDIESRVLTLPMWEDMTNELYDMLVGHEVAHALYTPTGAESLMSAIESIDANPRTWNIVKSYLNIVEDARIERLMQNRFPGLVTDFKRGYSQLMESGIFGDISSPADMGFADRINLHYKLGRFIRVPFSSDERVFIDRIDAADSWEEVVEISRDLYELADFEDEEENEQEEQSDPNGCSSPDGDAGEGGESTPGDESGEESGDDEKGSGEAGDEQSDDTDSSSSPDTGPSGESDEDVDANSSAGASTGGEPMRSRPKTDDALSNGLRNMARESAGDHESQCVYGTIGDMDIDRIIVEESEISTMIAEEITRLGSTTFPARASAYLKGQQSLVNIMAKQFELKKNAKTTARAMVAKTGTLDTVKMMSYKFTDDIFRKNTILPKGKNHGMLMFVDWSGSMMDQIADTIAQAINMAMFCKRAGIPFGVYAFTTSWTNEDDFHDNPYYNSNPKKGEFAMNGAYFNLLELCSSKLKGSNYQNALLNMVYLKDAFANSVLRGNKDHLTHRNHHLPRCLDLGGTPLEESIFAAGTLVKDMKRTGIEIVNTIFLTDGDGCGGPINNYNAQQFSGVGREIAANDAPGFVSYGDVKLRTGTKTIDCKNTKKAAFDWLRITTGANVVGFFLSKDLPYRQRCNDHTGEIFTKFKSDRFIILTNEEATEEGYDSYFILDPKVTSKQIRAFDDLGDEASAAKTRGAFIRQAKAKKTERSIMTEFATTVAEAH